MKNKGKKADKTVDLEEYIRSDGETVLSSEQSQTTQAAQTAQTTQKAIKKEEKIAAKRAKEAAKAERRQKRALRRNEDAALYAPDKMKGFPLSIPIGYLLRFFSIGLSVFGICALIVDSFELVEINLWALLLYCVGSVAAFSLCFIGGKLLFVGIGMIAAFIGGVFLLVGSPLTLITDGTERLWGRMMDMLEELGYATLSRFDLPSLGSLSVSSDSVEATLIYGGIFTLATLLGLIFAAFSAKRTRIIPMLIFGGLICALCFTYNLTGSNIGIVSILAGLSSTIVLSAYDRLYAEHKNSKKSRAYSGFSSALAGLLVIAVLAGPAAAIKNPWREIKAISRPISSARNIVMTLLTGGDPRLNVMNSLIDKRSAELEDIHFDGVQLFEVSSYTKNQNIYLRSWIASDFNESDDSWNLLTDEDYKDMLAAMRNRYAGISGDTLTYSLYRRLDEWLDSDSFPTDKYYGDSKLGYYATLVDVKSIKSTGLLYTMPQTYAGSSIGNYEYLSREDKYSESVELYSDGIYSSSWLNLKKEFTAPAILPTYTNKNYATNAANAARYNLLVNDFLKNAANIATSDADDIRERFTERLKLEGLSSYGTAGIEEFLESSNRRQWIAENVNAYEEYADYVKEFYGKSSSLESVKTIAAELYNDINAASTDFDKAMAVVNYMILNYSYTTEPTKPSGEYESDIDSFLLETKDGYCVQFATAATLILRELGIPARYVQGYLANDFYESKDDEGNKIFKSSVTDEDAHAWVEIWIDGLGWRTLEVTPSYYSDIYYVDRSSGSNLPSIVDQDKTTSRPEITTKPETSDTVATDDDKKDEGDDEKGKFTLTAADIAKICISIGSIAVIALALLLIYRRQKKIRAGRDYYIERAIYGSFADTAEMAAISGVLIDCIWEVIKLTVAKPRTGETPQDFAYRVDHPSRPDPRDKKAASAIRRRLAWSHTMAEITETIEELEFSGEISRDGLEKLGEFAESLTKTEYSALSIPKKLWYRYVRAIM